MIIEVLLCVSCVGSFAVYIAYVASRLQRQDPLLFNRRNPDPELVSFFCCNPYRQEM